MQNDDDQANPLEASSREFSRAVDDIKAGILAAGEPRPKISEEERARRKAAIDFARGSVRFEGVVLSPEVEEINRRFIDGEITGDEHIEAIKAAVKAK